MDLSKCFDTLDHDLIIRRFRQRITDGSVLSLLRQFLESGVMVGYHLEETELGSPQGRCQLRRRGRRLHTGTRPRTAVFVCR
tara:strand:+ start:1360 stop:1605 length:246 start_codon:yes stop_codon:yes gene_type:complete